MREPKIAVQSSPWMLDIYVEPSSKRDEVSGLKGGRLLIKVKADPIAGYANEGVVKLLSSFFGIDIKKMMIIKGGSSQRKTVRSYCTEEEYARISERLLPLSPLVPLLHK